MSCDLRHSSVFSISHPISFQPKYPGSAHRNSVHGQSRTISRATCIIIGKGDEGLSAVGHRYSRSVIMGC
jgi:hypothetical protein